MMLEPLLYIGRARPGIAGLGSHIWSRLRSGVVFAYVGRYQNLKDLKVLCRGAGVAARTRPPKTTMSIL